MIKHCVLQLNIFSLDVLQKKTEYNSVNNCIQNNNVIFNRSTFTEYIFLSAINTVQS